MKKIDTDTWKEISIPSVFNMSNTKSIVQRDIVPDSGDIPYVTASSENNGVLTYIACPPEWIDKGNCIMIGGKTLTFTYQGSDFCSNDSHNLALYIKNSQYATEPCYLFLIAALRASLRQKYSWGDSISMRKIVKDKVHLPTDSNGQPDWAYMESFMKDVLDESKTCLKNLRYTKTEKTAVELKNWKKFHLYDNDLFDIDMGTKLDKSKMTTVEPTVNFIGRANQNNGITEYVDAITDIEPYESGNMTLSLGGEYLGSCFVQPVPFYTSQNVVVLKPKWQMPFNVKMFISVVIFRESQQYYKAFVNELNRHIKTDFSFYLPVDNDGKPDWEYMDSYMQSILKDSSNSQNRLKEVIE